MSERIQNQPDITDDMVVASLDQAAAIHEKSGLGNNDVTSARLELSELAAAGQLDINPSELGKMNNQELVDYIDYYTSDSYQAKTSEAMQDIRTTEGKLARFHKGFKAFGFALKIGNIRNKLDSRAIDVASGDSGARFKNKMNTVSESQAEKGNWVRSKTAHFVGVAGLTATVILAYRVTRLTGLGLDGVEDAFAGAPSGGDALTSNPSILPGDFVGPPAPDDLLNTKSDVSGYLRPEDHISDRMSTEGAFDSQNRNMEELDSHVLAKIENNPSLMASVLEIRESGHMDHNVSLEEINKDTSSYAVGGEHGVYSEKGEQAQGTLGRSWENGEQGKLMSNEQVRGLQEKYNFINHGTTEGTYQNAIDDKTYRAGVFDYRPELGDKLYSKELGNGRTVFFKVNEQDPTRDCLNVITLEEKKLDTNTFVPETDKPDSTPEKPEEPKEPPTTPPTKPPVEPPVEPPTTPPTKPPVEPPVEPPKSPPETPPETPPVTNDAKDPSKDINRNPNLNPDANGNGHTAGPGEQKPATQPPETYKAPAAPTPEASTPRTDTPPVQSNPETGQNANGSDGVNNGTPSQQPSESGV